MTAIYFIGGLGSNAYHAQDLIDALGCPVQILDLPGHGRAFDDVIHTPKDLIDWFSKQVVPDQAMILIGHSLGAALAGYLAQTLPKVKALILLDGGYFDLDQIISLEDELAGTQQYLRETCYETMQAALDEAKQASLSWSSSQALAVQESLTWRDGNYKLKLNEATILGLVTIHRQLSCQLHTIDCPTLLLPQTLERPEWKTSMLSAVPPHIQIVQLTNCSHSPHLDQPREVAQAIINFLALS